jgi:hypothetical protein
MTQVLRAFSYGNGGLGVAMLALIAGWALPRAAGLERPITAALLPWLWGIVCASMLAEFVLTGWYLFSPAYLDHVEASVISSVHTLIAGVPLYPSLDSYTLSGLLYGPLLAEADSLGYVVFHDAFSIKIVGWLAGWVSVAVLVVQVRHNARGAGSLAALTYALSYLLSFGADVTVARPEPLLLLLAASSLAVALNVEGPLGSILLGLLCGAAVGLKLHAPVYLLPSIYLWVIRQTAQPRQRGLTSLAVCFCVAAAAGVALPFVPHNVSAAGYLRFLALAAKHGLSLDLLGRNCAFVAGIWAPVLILGGSCSRTTRSWRGFAFTLLAAECLVAVIASKPGAGVHHFLPFLAPHALLFQQLYVQTAPAAAGRAVLAAAAAVFGMVTPTAQTYCHLLAFDLQLPEQTRQRDELLRFAMRFPRGILGVADNESSDLANFRPWLTAAGIPQVDYGAFMDLQLSGVTDEALSSAFARCAIPYVYMPKPGLPFTLLSNYHGHPLFSDELRHEFAAHYSRLDAGVYFDVFGCDRAVSHSQLLSPGALHTRTVPTPVSSSAAAVR